MKLLTQYSHANPNVVVDNVTNCSSDTARSLSGAAKFHRHKILNSTHSIANSSTHTIQPREKSQENYCVLS
jgi:hypothetical protein